MGLIKNNIPLKFTKGTTVTCQIPLPDFPAPTWALKVVFIKDDLQKIITATAIGSDHLVTIQSDIASTFKAGEYAWQAVVTSGSDRHIAKHGTTTVLPDFEENTDGLDHRSHTKIVLDALNSMIVGKASKDQQSYTIAGRSIARLSPEELLTWRDRYAADYIKEKRTERRRNGKPTGQTIKVSF